MKLPAIAAARLALQKRLAKDTLLIDAKGIPTNADSSNPLSKRLAVEVLKSVPHGICKDRPSGQTLGSQMEKAVHDFVQSAFLALDHLRPGDWTVRSGAAISEFDQYQHLTQLEAVLSKTPELRSSLGSDYIIKPDIVVARNPEDDQVINRPRPIVDSKHTRLSPLRKANSKHATPILHASISCKWTFRSDRAQNSRSEALNLIRNRKGHLPHVVVVTAEPLPSRLASLCFGTGDIDCVYHVFLDELQAATNAVGDDSARDLLAQMIEGKRLKDISDLPLDLAV